MHRLKLVAFVLLAAITTFVNTGQALAASGEFGRSDFYGYFYNNYQSSGDFVFSEGMYVPSSNSVNWFISAIQSRLAGGTQDSTGAAFIILTMMGQPAGTPKSQANALFNQWASLVRQYDAAGRVNWNGSYYWQCGQLNSLYQTSYADDAFYHATATTRESNPCNSYIPSVIFTSPGGGTYVIKRNCGNLIGNVSPLQPLTATVSGRVYNKTTGAALPNAVIDLCNGITARTDSSGNWSHTFNQGDGFCARQTSAVPPGWSGPTTNNNPEHSTATTYEYQIAGVNCYHTCSNPQGTWDRNTDSGYDFIYTSGAASCVSITAPGSVTVGQTFNAQVIIKNGTSQTWSGAQNYNLGSQSPQDNTIWAPLSPGVGSNNQNRAEAVQGSVSNGQNAVFNFTATAPATIGTYPFAWEVVHDGVAWIPNGCSTNITVNPKPILHRIFGANFLQIPLSFMRDNFSFVTNLSAYFWPDAGIRNRGTDNTNSLWLAGIWGQDSGDTVAADNSVKADPNYMTSFNTVAERNCPPSLGNITCLERVPLAYVPKDDGSGVANTATQDGSQTPNGNLWQEIRDRILNFGYSPRYGGVASNLGYNIGGHIGNWIKNVEISNIHVLATNISADTRDQNAQGGITSSAIQSNSSGLAPLPPNSQGPVNPDGSPKSATWDNVRNPNDSCPSGNASCFDDSQAVQVPSLEFPNPGSPAEFTAEPEQMYNSTAFWENQASLYGHYGHVNLTSLLQDGMDQDDSPQYTKGSEPLSYTATVNSINATLKWDEYVDWSQVDDKGHYYTSKAYVDTGVSYDNPNPETVGYYYVTNYGNWCATWGVDSYGNPVCTSYNSYYCYPSYPSQDYTYPGYYYSTGPQTMYGWINSSASPTGNEPWGGPGQSAPSYFAGYESSNPPWSNTGTNEYWQDTSVTPMSNVGSTNKPAHSNYWIYDTSDPVYNSRWLFNNYTNTTLYNGYSQWDGACAYSDGSWGYSTTTMYYQNYQYLYENTSSLPYSNYQGTYGAAATHDGSEDGYVDYAWNWVSNYQRVRYEETYTGHSRKLGLKSRTGGGDTLLYGLSGYPNPIQYDRATSIISNPIVSAANGDIFGAGGISSYFQNSGANSAFLFTNNSIQNFTANGQYQQYCINNDRERVNGYFPTTQTPQPPLYSCGTDSTDDALSYIIKDLPTMETGGHYTDIGSSIGGNFNLTNSTGNVWRASGDLSINGVNFCTSGPSSSPFDPQHPNGAGTIVVDGNLYIHGNVNYCAPSANDRQHLPSVGFLVKGNIMIDSGVGVVNGSYFTNQTFADGSCTVDPSTGNPTNNRTCSDPQFTLNGLVVARDIYLQRQLANNAGATQTEGFNYDGRVVIAPPPGFTYVFTAPAVWNEGVPYSP